MSTFMILARGGFGGQKTEFPLFCICHIWKHFWLKNNDNPRECFFRIWCYSGSHGELLFCRCACALVVFYISIVFDNDGQLRMMNKWMMAENEFERLDDTTSSFTYIQNDGNRSTYHMKYLPHWHSFPSIKGQCS